MKREDNKDFDFSILKELRQGRGLSLNSLAERTGLSYATLARIESNRYQPSLNTIKVLAEFFGITPAHLLELTTSYIVEHKSEKNIDVKPSGRREVAFGGIKLRMGAGKSGQKAKRPHQHIDYYQITWVLKGRMVVRIHNRDYELKKGQALKFDAAFSHNTRFIDDTEFIVALIPKKGR